jgi:hypothetical protein
MTITIEIDDKHIPELQQLVSDIDTFGDVCYTGDHNDPRVLAGLEMSELLSSEEDDEGLLYYLTDLGRKVLQQAGGSK